MPAISDFEIGIERNGSGMFSVRVRHSSESSEAGVLDIVPEEQEVSFDFEAFNAKQTPNARLGLDIGEYGQKLWDTFCSGLVKDHLGPAVASLAPGDRLRMRLLLDQSARDLHDLIWELLPDVTVPDVVSGAVLATSERIIFSRYITTTNFQRSQLRGRDDLRALVVIANPSDLGNYNGEDPGDDRGSTTGEKFDDIDVVGELTRARHGLQACGAEVVSLASGGAASLERIVSHLKQREGFDILYLVCHGQRVQNQPRLWLEHRDGTAHVVSGKQFVEGLHDIENKPRLVVLASCMSAGSDGTDNDEDRRLEDRGTMAAVGPQLAAIGIPAVLAMQGDITMASTETFMPAFFAHLGDTGSVDQSVAAARKTISNRRDAWMPVLFTRLKHGRMWYEPRLISGNRHQSSIAWDALITQICKQNCTVILGSGLLEKVIGSQRSMAQEWATKRRFPLEPSETDDLPQISQYVATLEGEPVLREELADWMVTQMRKRYRDDLGEDLDSFSVREVMPPIGRILRERHPYEPHKILAQLPFPVYISTNPDDFMLEALKEANRTDVQRLVFPWQEEQPYAAGSRGNEMTDNGFHDATEDNEPTEIDATWEQPLVYHMFGHLSNPGSIVLTEDNFFELLTNAVSNSELIPPVIKGALKNKGLLFLGFQMTDWDFRVMLRIIKSLPGRRARNMVGTYRHIAVQVDPVNYEVQDPAWLRNFMEGYFRTFGIGEEPTVFWGDTNEFVRALHDRWMEKYRAFPTYPVDFDASRECGCDPRVKSRW